MTLDDLKYKLSDILNESISKLEITSHPCHHVNNGKYLSYILLTIQETVFFGVGKAHSEFLSRLTAIQGLLHNIPKKSLLSRQSEY